MHNATVTVPAKGRLAHGIAIVCLLAGLLASHAAWAECHALPTVLIMQDNRHPDSLPTVKDIAPESSTTCEPPSFIDVTIPSPLALKELQQRQMRLFKQGTAAYFDGLFSKGDALFSQMIEETESHLSLLAHVPQLRSRLFNAYMYRAMCQRAMQQNVDATLEAAAKRFGTDTSPDISEFPPWLCDAYSLVSKDVTPPARSIELNTASLPSSQCRITVNGTAYSVETFPKTIAVPAALKTTCVADETDIHSPVTLVSLAPEPFRYHPVMVTATFISQQNGQWLFYYPNTPDTRTRLPHIIDDIKMVIPDSRKAILVDSAGTPPTVSIVSLDDALRGITATAPYAANLEIDPDALISDAPTVTLNTPAIVPSPWHRNIRAWTVLGLGTITAATGIALGIGHGTRTPIEPLAVGMQLGGLALMSTGGILFVLPTFHATTDYTTVTINSHLSF